MKDVLYVCISAPKLGEDMLKKAFYVTFSNNGKFFPQSLSQFESKFKLYNFMSF